MSENEFELLQGNSYRGSRYGNFFGGGIDAQGNVSSAEAENAATSVGTSSDVAADAPPTPLSPSQGLTEPELPRTSDLVIGAALPYAGNVVGKAAGQAIGAGASVSTGISEGASRLAGKVSGGLIGSTGASSTATNAALAARGGNFGPATSSAVSKASGGGVGTAGSGANIGAAVGSGFATAAAVLITGGDVKDAAKAGVGTAVGTAIGNVIAPGIGGFIGGFVGGLFCFAEDTPIVMADASIKAVQEVKIGDELMHGGTVVAAGQAYADELYTYKNTVVTSKHAVFEDGKWIRVEDSELAEPFEMEDDYAIVYPIATSDHIILTPWYISADLLELDEEYAEGKTQSEIIDFLNEMEARNEELSKIERHLADD